jgi:hypothetical protein
LICLRDLQHSSPWLKAAVIDIYRNHQLYKFKEVAVLLSTRAILPGAGEKWDSYPVILVFYTVLKYQKQYYCNLNRVQCILYFPGLSNHFLLVLYALVAK